MRQFTVNQVMCRSIGGEARIAMKLTFFVLYPSNAAE
jgi:hypothetical protein